MRIVVSTHALTRYRERVEPASRRQVANRVARHLLPALTLGLQPDGAGAVHVGLGGELWAVAAPSLQGGWELITIYRTGEEEFEDSGLGAGSGKADGTGVVA